MTCVVTGIRLNQHLPAFHCVATWKVFQVEPIKVTEYIQITFCGIIRRGTLRFSLLIELLMKVVTTATVEQCLCVNINVLQHSTHLNFQTVDMAACSYFYSRKTEWFHISLQAVYHHWAQNLVDRLKNLCQTLRIVFVTGYMYDINGLMVFQSWSTHIFFILRHHSMLYMLSIPWGTDFFIYIFLL